MEEFTLQVLENMESIQNCKKRILSQQDSLSGKNTFRYFD